MYCPVCGAESTQGLNYCKRCGATLSPIAGGAEPRPALRSASLLPVALVSVVGLIGFFVTIVALANSKIDQEALIGVAAFGGATVFGVVGLLIWLLTQLSGVGLRSSHVNKGTRSVSGSSTQPQLSAPSVSVPSVTENTTRNFDPPVYREKGVRE